MHILLSNDDGILAPGLAAMYRALTDLGTVTVVAPDSVQSATAHGITVREAINVRRIRVQHEFDGWSVGGRPADCIKLAMLELCETRPDLIVAGINDGANVSINVLYSGTVAAAAEGAILGVPAVAVSLQRGPESDFDRAAAIARKVIDHLLDYGLSPGKLVNINIPLIQPGWPKGVRVAEQALQTMDDAYEMKETPDGLRQYTLDGDFAEPAGPHETDLHALASGYVVVTPLKVDLTDRGRLNDLERLNWPSLA
jgi:5'-nucleotidase